MTERTLYDGNTEAIWLGMLEPVDGAMQRHCLAMFALLGVPSSYLDVGCGTGIMPRTARALGVEAYGIDQLSRPEPYLRQADLRQGFDFGRQFQIVSCVEVAEHIPADSEAPFLDSLAAHVAMGGVLVFTSPWPSEADRLKNRSHVALNYPDYWRTALQARGLSYNHWLTVQLALLWSHMWSPLSWLPLTLQVFNRGTPDLPSGAGR